MLKQDAWTVQVTKALADLQDRDGVEVQVDMDDPRLLVESELVDAYRMYRGEDECVTLMHSLEVADIHG
jgi:hypothetical protein